MEGRWMSWVKLQMRTFVPSLEKDWDLSELRHVWTPCFLGTRPEIHSQVRTIPKFWRFFGILLISRNVYFNVCLNKACAVLCENGASGFRTGSVWVISNISTSSKTILNKTPHFARPRQPCCVQLEADRSISWRVVLVNLAPSHEHCSSFSPVETNKRQFSFWLLLFLKVVGVFFAFFFKNTCYATTFRERRNQLCLVKKRSEG